MLSSLPLAAFGADFIDPAPLDTLEQQAIYEAAKELFTLEQIRALARVNGTEAKTARVSLNASQAGRDVAQMGLHDTQYAASLGASVNVPSVVSSLETADKNLNTAKATVESQAELSSYSGEEQAFSWVQLQASLALLDKSIALSREQLKIDELRAQIGLGTDTDVQKRELALDELLDRKQTLLVGIDLAGRNLMRYLGQPEDMAFRLDVSFSIEGMTTSYDPEELAILAVKNNIDLRTANENIDRDKTTIARGTNVGMVDGIAQDILMTPSEKQLAGAQLDAAIYARDNRITQLQTVARSTATGLETTKASLVLLEKSVADKQSAYELMSLQVSLGLAPRIGLAGAELELLTAQNALLTAQQNYYLSLRRASLLVKGVQVAR